MRCLIALVRQLELGRATVTVRAAMVDTLVVTPQSSELDPDHDLQFVATALDARGNVLRGQVIVWASSDVGICAISQQGRAISIAPGRATVTAHCGDVKGSAAVKVRPLTVARVVVQPGDLSIEVEETRHLSAMVFGMLPLRTISTR